MSDQATRISELEQQLEEAESTLRRLATLDARGRAHANRLAFKVSGFFGTLYGTATAIVIFSAGQFLGIYGWPVWTGIVAGYAFWYTYVFARRRHTWLAHDQMSAILGEYVRDHNLFDR